MKTVAVVGASGFLGQAVVEQLNRSQTCCARAIAHSSGNAWALVSAGVPIHFADLSEPGSIQEVLSGCTHVVNCSRGNKKVMIQGLRNLLQACHRVGIERLVHISSVAIYGSRATTSELSEDAEETPDTGYGELKLSQDRLVINARENGLESIILCPPNISGAGSPFLNEVYTSLAQKQFAYVDHGDEPLELVDVRNLAYAIQLAVTCPLPARNRYFVTDCERITWADLVTQLENTFNRGFTIASVPSANLASISMPTGERKLSFIRALKHLVSSDVRAALRLNPLWEKLDIWIRGLIAKLPSSLEDKARLSIEGTLPVPSVDYLADVDKRLCEQQLKRVRYSCTRANEDLGYEPQISFEDSIAAFSRWRLADREILGNYLGMLNELES